LSNSENPLIIRACKDGKKMYQSLGISINPQYWNFEKSKLKQNCPDKEQLLTLIAENTKVYSEQIIEFKTTNKYFTATLGGMNVLED
jgi:hypothetical protein